LVLITDGLPTDDFGGRLQALLARPWAGKAVRIAIALGSRTDDECLEKFIGAPASEIRRANNSRILVQHLHWIATDVTRSALASASRLEGPTPQTRDLDRSTDDIW
jgi:hypothetical protein